MKVAVVMPTLASRPEFFAQAKFYLERQTRKPDVFLDISHGETPDSEGIDVAWRYYYGFKQAFEFFNCDCVITMEDDDFYSSVYIETILREWEKAGKPQLFGIGETYYYNIISQRWIKLEHPGRASMMSTLVTPSILTHKFDFKDPYLDFRIWTSQKFIRKTFVPDRPISVGIKHGIGPVAGGGHPGNWPKYNQQDKDYSMLSQLTGSDVVFYKIMAQKDNYEISKRVSAEHPPFLSIITRCHGSHRPNGLNRNMESINRLYGKWEQIFITDKKGLGLYYANMSFMLARQQIRGEYVYLMDDDDKINNPDMIAELSKVVKDNDNPDVIVFRMLIKTGAFNNYYPSPECWKKRIPILAHIGGSCMVVKTEAFKKHIHAFGQQRFGDFFFLKSLYDDKRMKWYWHDSLMAETGGKPSHGAKEKP